MEVVALRERPLKIARQIIGVKSVWGKSFKIIKILQRRLKRVPHQGLRLVSNDFRHYPCPR